MNARAHMSGQISGQVPNQAGNQLPGLHQPNGNAFHQPNGNAFHTQVQNLGGQHNPSVMDPEVMKVRFAMRNKIREILMRKQSQPMNDLRIQDISRRLEEGLFKLATSKDEYLNLNNLESRLHALVRRTNNHHQPAQHPQFVNTSTPVGTMIPTPGLQHSDNSNLSSSAMDLSIIPATACGSISSSALSTGSLMATASRSFSGLRGISHAAEGCRPNGYQQSPSSFSMNSSGNNTMAGQSFSSQMIPTPGFSSSTNHTHTNVETSSNGSVFSSVDSAAVPQQVPQKNGGQNSRVSQNLGSGMRPFMQQRFQVGAVNNGYMTKPQVISGSGSSDSYLTTTSYVTSSKPLQQPVDQLQQPVVQGDGYQVGSADSSGTGKFFNNASSIGSLNSQNISQMRSQAIRRNNSLMSNQVNMQTTQLAEQLVKLNSEPSASLKDSHLQPSAEQYQQQPRQLPHQQQPSTYRLQKQPSVQQQALLGSDAFIQSQVASDLGCHMKQEPGTEHQNEASQSQVSSGQFQLSELQSQFQQNSDGNYLRGTQLSSIPSGSQDLCSTVLNNPQQRVPSEVTVEHSLQEDFHQRVVGHDEAQHNNLSSDMNAQTVASRSAADNSISGGFSCNRGNVDRERQLKNQRWLLFLRHARGCKAPEGKCLEPNCFAAQKLLKHMDGCNASRCLYARCYHSKKLMHHHRICRDLSCPVCVPVKNFIRSTFKMYARPELHSGLPSSVSGSCKSLLASEIKPKDPAKPSEKLDTSENLQPPVKRMKMELPLQPSLPENVSTFLPNTNCTSHDSTEVKRKEFETNDDCSQMKSEFLDVKAEILSSSNPSATEVKNISADSYCNQSLDGVLISNDCSLSAKEEHIKVETDNGLMKPDEVAQPTEQSAGTKSGKPMIKGVSLTELFTPEQIREHITGLRQWVGQTRAKAEKNQAMEHSMNENACQLCAVEKLTFEPPPVYCSPCGARIKRNALYYTIGGVEARHFFCIPCYNESRGDAVVVDGNPIAKSRLEKKRNDDETEEWWVQCDKCEAWQHQICALFNGRRNDGGQAEYTCPNCLIQEIESGERKPLPQSAVLGAKDLPRTILSDHIEHRLFKRLKHERQERARVQGKSYDEVPGAEGLVLRVVSSVDKKLEVKPRFLDIFLEENYPTEFAYKSKVVLLFQKIEGVEVCLFGMYVQEFGSECLPPNQRRVYLSYLDSVKYFRPDVRTVTGEALRTSVYHEILIGYLEYCKLRGFTSCYIWACPPLKGEDYILYCHPEIQKTPKSDKLREWYLAMLRKATRENIVVDLVNLYDHFFVQTGECKGKVTAARLPYFDGDYWPGAAEDMICQIIQEEEGRKHNKKGTTKKTKRALKASGQSDLSSNASKDILLMHKLGETISPMKEDFIMVHLQHACTHCCLLMVSGNRWVCEVCKKFQLCDKCHEAEQGRDDRERHPINQKDRHVLYRVAITDVPDDTKDKDEILESEFFDTRQAFLSLCQGNHYQYDTLRRAKHSSMMVLYHLHNPTAPAFVTTCNICRLDVEAGKGWRCETCSDYDVCNACYEKDGGIDHPHKLTNHPSLAEREQNKEARQQRIVELRKMLDLLVHASQCRSPHCQYPNCRKVKGLFRHGIHCKTRASGGCGLCKRMWYLLQLHARACKDSGCHVPRCRDLREHMRRLQQQSDSRRRAAVNEMMRQRAAEVAGN